MNSRERVTKTLTHQESDRVPVSGIGVDYTITEEALGRETLHRAKWKQYMALWQGRRDDYVESCKRDIVDLVRKFEWDFVPVFLLSPKSMKAKMPKFIGCYTWEEDDGRIFKFSPASGAHALCINESDVSIDDIVIPTRLEINDSELELVRPVIRELGNDHFILGRGYEDRSFPFYLLGWHGKCLNEDG